MANKLGLFNPSVPKKQLHPSFKLVQSSPRNKSTRRLMNDAFARFVEKDGNFVEQFQTTGFNTRTFELYVSELLHAEGFTFEGTEPQPDFCVSKNGVKVAIECTTANPTGSTLHVYEPMNEKDDDLGHANVNITLNTYAAYIPNMQADAAVRVNAWLR